MRLLLFQPGFSGPIKCGAGIIIDAVAVYSDGQEAGLILWGRKGELVSLEVYDHHPNASSGFRRWQICAPTKSVASNSSDVTPGTGMLGSTTKIVREYNRTWGSPSQSRSGLSKAPLTAGAYPKYVHQPPSGWPDNSEGREVRPTANEAPPQTDKMYRVTPVA
jgi:hypothetical protein